MENSGIPRACVWGILFAGKEKGRFVKNMAGILMKRANFKRNPMNFGENEAQNMARERPGQTEEKA